MRSWLRIKTRSVALVPALALICALPVAAGARSAAPRLSAHDMSANTEVEVKGVITAAPANGAASFTATAFLAGSGQAVSGEGDSGNGDDSSSGSDDGAPMIGGSSGNLNGINLGGGSGSGSGNLNGINLGSGSSSGSGSSMGLGDNLRRGHRMSHSMTAQGTPGTTITTDSSTQVTIDGQPSSVANLAVGDYFSAEYSGTTSETLAQITAGIPLSIEAHSSMPGGPMWSGNTLYAFVGTVASTDTTAGTVTVNVTSSIPSALFSGSDTFTLGQRTIVLGNSSSSLFGSLQNVSVGDVVAGGLIGPSGETANQVETQPLQLLVDFPVSSSGSTGSTSSTSSTSITPLAVRHAEKRALRLLRRKAAQLRHHHHRTHGKHKTKKHHKR